MRQHLPSDSPQPYPADIHLEEQKIMLQKNQELNISHQMRFNGLVITREMKTRPSPKLRLQKGRVQFFHG